jgi:hypothetical protein
MNRSILIVICDFLLISLLAFSTIDIEKVADPGAASTLSTKPGAPAVDPGRDLAAVMRQALEDERRNQEKLAAELAQSRQAAADREQLAASLKQDQSAARQRITEMENRLIAAGKQLEAATNDAATLRREQSAARQSLAAAEGRIESLSKEATTLKQEQETLRREQESLKKEQAAVQQRAAAAETRLQAVGAEANATARKLAAAEALANQRAQDAAALQSRLDQLARSNESTVAEGQKLALQLKTVEVEKKAALEQVARLRDDVRVEREEKAKLTEGMVALAAQSGNLAREIRESRPLAPNIIFSDFLTNRLQAAFHGRRPGFLGFDSNRERRTGTILIGDGTNVFALCHLNDTPLALVDPGGDWEELSGTLTRGTAVQTVGAIGFAALDPRVVFIPVRPDAPGAFGSKVYTISSDPYRFQDAVVIGAGEGYYGECKFEIDESAPGYVHLDRRFLKSLVGLFNPSAGDFVFSRTGEFLGVMVNDSYCVLVRRYAASVWMAFGPNLRVLRTSETMARLNGAVTRMPSKLQ